MRTKRIELEGQAGWVAIERPRLGDTIRIDSVIRDPKGGQQAWMSWDIPASTSAEKLFAIAQTVQQRCDGSRGTNSMINDYYRELQRFVD